MVTGVHLYPDALKDFEPKLRIVCKKMGRTVLANDKSTEVQGSLIQTAFVKGQLL